MNNEKLSFLEHLEELRFRLIRCLVAILISFSLCSIFAKNIFAFLAKPIKAVLPPNSSLIFTSPTEALVIYLKSALIASLFVASPFVLYQLWKFISPGLYDSEKKYVIPFVVTSSILFIGGALFGYFFVFPPAFKFLLTNFASDLIRPLPSMKEYFSLTTKLLLAFGLIFETPVFFFFLSKIGLVNYRMLLKFQKYAIVLAFFLGAILTPGPDVFSQFLMAIPLLILYEASIFITWLFGKKENK